MKPTYNRLHFDYGYDGEALQEVVNGTETRILTLDGEMANLPEEYGCSVVEADVPTPAWAPDVIDADTAPPPPEAPKGFRYIVVPNV